MFKIILEVVPMPKSDHFDEFEGAYVSCYINFQGQEGAIHLAKYYIKQEGWKFVSIDSVTRVDARNIKPQSEAETAFAEALEGGASFFYHTWDKKGTDK